MTKLMYPVGHAQGVNIYESSKVRRPPEYDPNARVIDPGVIWHGGVPQGFDWYTTDEAKEVVKSLLEDYAKN